MKRSLVSLVLVRLKPLQITTATNRQEHKMRLIFIIVMITFITLNVQSQTKRTILISSFQEETSQLFSYNLDTLVTTPLTPVDYDVSSPQISSQKTHVAFSRWQEGDTDIFVLNLINMQITKIHENLLRDDFPTWSPDGTKIAFTSDDSIRSDIFVINLDGGGLTNITQNTTGGALPDWSLDGSRIAYLRDNAIYVMNLSTNMETLIFSGIARGNPRWSPDNSKIAFKGENGSLNYINLPQNTVNGIIDFGEFIDFEWVDNNTIVYDYGMQGVFTIDVDGTNQIRLPLNVDLYSSYSLKNVGSYFQPPIPPTVTPSPTPCTDTVQDFFGGC